MEQITLEKLNQNILELKKLVEDGNREAFSARQAANYLSISYDTILRLARIGQIDYIKNGTSYIFRKKHLDKWLDKQERRANR